jgi:hypothetical protein
MSETSSNDLSKELAALSDLFSELGERLLTVARQLHAPGAPPPDELIQSLNKCRADFASVRGRARAQAGAVSVPCPSDEQLTTLNELSGLIDQLAEAEIRQSKSEELRRRALSVLDRVLSLSHATGPDFAPLSECQEGARALRDSIASGHWTGLPAETEKVAEGEHHFADLLALIEDHDELADDVWAKLHDSVSQAFGRPLAAAAARSKLVLPAGAAAR